MFKILVFQYVIEIELLQIKIAFVRNNGNITITKQIQNMAPRIGEILLLYKQLLREAQKFPNYMYR